MFEKLLFKYVMKSLPVSRSFGFDRGTPIDRYYIEKFLSENSSLICGQVLEIADSIYTKKFGKSGIEKNLVLHVEETGCDSDIIGDLATGKGIHEGLVDCFIQTQTLLCIYNIKEALANSMKLLKPGGVLLMTVPGITQISRFDMDRWGHFWSFTDLSIRRLFEEFVPRENITINTYGNAKSAAAFLYGLASNEIRKEDLDFFDPDYQLIITAIVRKPN
jgi:hypothetical protein